jgi:hypothetical protein
MCEENQLNCDILDIRKLYPLRRIQNYTDMIPGEYYLAVSSRNNIPVYNWKTRFEFIGLINKDTVIGRCTIMDGNYSFTRLFMEKDTVFYYSSTR